LLAEGKVAVSIIGPVCALRLLVLGVEETFDGNGTVLDVTGFGIVGLLTVAGGDETIGVLGRDVDGTADEVNGCLFGDVDGRDLLIVGGV
jgi:hypothetical protein